MTNAPLPEPARPAGPSDEAIVESVRGGDVARFEVLMRRHNQRVYRACRAILRDEADIEDAMQQAYLAAFAHLAQFRANARFSTWIVRIAVNEALQRRRRDRHLVAIGGTVGEEEEAMGPGPDGMNPEHGAADRELAGFVERTIDELPELYRIVFVLREVEGFDTAQTADALEVSEEVVKTRLHRAKAMLRDRLQSRLGAALHEAFTFGQARCDRIVARVLQRIAL